MPSSDPSPVAARAVRVLIGDHDRRVRSALAQLLSVAGGFEVSAVHGDTAEVLKVASERHPDVAIIDLLKPDAETGLQLVAELRKLAVPVVAMSAHGGLRAAALASGAASFLQKDGKPETFLDAVHSATAHPQPRATP